MEDGDLKDHCLLCLGLNIRLFITLNGFTKPNVNRNVFLFPSFESNFNKISPLAPHAYSGESSAVL